MAEYMRNALFGLAVGDALGVPHEKKPRGSFKCVGWDYTPEPDRKRMWSDDTALTLAELDSFGILKKMVSDGQIFLYRTLLRSRKEYGSRD